MFTFNFFGWNKIVRDRAVVSHISRKTSEMWGTLHFRLGQRWEMRLLLHLAYVDSVGRQLDG